MAKITVLIVDDIPETRENLSKLLYFEPDLEIAGTAANGREAIDLARKLQPNIVLMDINMPDMDGITASQEIPRVAPLCQVIMMSVQSEADYLRRSMLAGAMDFLTKPFTSEELSSSIRRVYQMGASRRAAMPALLAEADLAGIPGWGAAPGGRPPARGKVLMVFSPKGGTGCTTVAVNLAVALHNEETPVVLVDGNLQFGDVAIFLNEQAKNSVIDLTPRADELSRAQCLVVDVRHRNSGGRQRSDGDLQHASSALPGRLTTGPERGNTRQHEDGKAAHAVSESCLHDVLNEFLADAN